MKTKRQLEIFGLIMQNQPINISEIIKKLKDNISIPTLNRDLAILKKEKVILVEGSDPSIKYKVNVDGLISAKIDKDVFFQIESDDRKIIATFNTTIIEKLAEIPLFTKEENEFLQELTQEYKSKISDTNVVILNKEFERLMIELS